MKRIIVLSITLFLGIGFGAYCQDPIILTVSQPDQLLADAGNDIEISKGESTIIGGNPSALDGYGNYIYSWTPVAGLDDPTLANPLATPEINTSYLLTVTDANNCSATSEVTVSVDASGIDLNSTSLQILCFPNPVEDELIIEILGTPTLVKIRLFNTMGTELIYIEKMMPGGEATERISMNNFSSGLYYLQIISEEKSYYQSIIKTR